jgi:fatty-acyl-CoA synthase
MAAVISAAHAKWEERPVLIVTPKQGASIDEEEMLDFLRPRVARWWLPDRVLTVEQMPMTATGKIRKATLRAEYRDVLQQDLATPAAVGQN